MKCGGVLLMPFGKYRGRPVSKTPRGYLEWVLSNLDLENEPYLKEEIRKQLGFDKVLARKRAKP